MLIDRMSKIFSSKLILTLSLIFFGQVATSSDHVDHPTSSDPVTDITDLYAFQSPEDSRKIILVLNTYLFPKKSAHLSTNVGASFVLRKAEYSQGQWTYPRDTEKRIACRYKNNTKKHKHAPNLVECALLSPQNKKGWRVDHQVEVALGKVATPSSFRVFAGRRADPFIFNTKWTGAMMKGEIPKAKELREEGLKNSLEKADTFSLVVEVDKLLVGGHSGILAVTAETQDLSHGSVHWPRKSYPRFDRVGVPEITNIVLASVKKKKEFRRRYNSQPTFDQESGFRAEFEDYFSQTLKHYDQYDKVTNWSEENIKAASKSIVDDTLLLNLSANSRIPRFSYFSLQSQALLGLSFSSRGGRRLEDDFMDELFTWLIKGPNSKVASFSDGVDEPKDAIKEEFPFLANPNYHKNGWINLGLFLKNLF